MNVKLVCARLKPVARTLLDHFTAVVSPAQNIIIFTIDATILTSAHQVHAITTVATISAVSNVHVATGSRLNLKHEKTAA